MRAFILALATVAAVTSAGATDLPLFHAGFIRVTVQDAEPFDTSVWYPTKTTEVPFQAGPFTIAATRDAKIAEGARFPVVLLSHGRGGSPLGHRELAAHLARDGFVVVAPTHIGDSSEHAQPRPQLQVLADRPRQARMALDKILTDPRFSQNVDATRIGAVGFSAGGYTALMLAGARPNFAHAAAYCRDHADDRGSCAATATSGSEGSANADKDIAEWPSMLDPRIKAIALMDPLAFVFDSKGLASVRIPTLLLRPVNDDYLSSKGNALALAVALPNPPLQVVVTGSHFVFIEPCPSEVAEVATAQCKDAPSVDRTAVHRQIENAISDFLRRNL
jgi:predicted dienelactone hydrolase